MVVCFISGHVDVDNDFFKEHYEERILDAIGKNHGFLVGDSKGVDEMAYKFVQQHGGNIEIVPRDKFNSFNARDKYLTEMTHYDIAYVRTEEEQKKLYGERYKKRESATERNLKRREKLINLKMK